MADCVRFEGGQFRPKRPTLGAQLPFEIERCRSQSQAEMSLARQFDKSKAVPLCKASDPASG